MRRSTVSYTHLDVYKRQTWERHFVAWAEGAGYPLAHATTYDLEFLPNLLTPYDVVVIAGHSEYWTWNMRQRVKAYVAGGGRFLNQMCIRDRCLLRREQSVPLALRHESAMIPLLAVGRFFVRGRRLRGASLGNVNCRW